MLPTARPIACDVAPQYVVSGVTISGLSGWPHNYSATPRRARSPALARSPPRFCRLRALKIPSSRKPGGAASGCWMNMPDPALPPLAQRPPARGRSRRACNSLWNPVVPCESGRGRLRVGLVDQVPEYAVRDCGLMLIIDLMHYGTPLWLDYEFLNRGDPQAVV